LEEKPGKFPKYGQSCAFCAPLRLEHAAAGRDIDAAALAEGAGETGG
jgi:hypothetical protein